MKTDLKRLHHIHNVLSQGGILNRQAGFTIYTCHLIAGYLEVLENEKISVVLASYKRLNSFLPVLTNVLNEHNLEVDAKKSSKTKIFIKNNTNVIEILSANDFNCYPSKLLRISSIIPIQDLD